MISMSSNKFQLKKEASQKYKPFLGILMACEFTVVAIILSFAKLNSKEIDMHLILSILWLIISIFTFFDSYIAFISFDLYGKSKFYSYARVCYYPGFYSFYVSIIHLLLSVEFTPIAFLAYFVLFTNIIFWTRRFYKIGKEIHKHIEKRKNLKEKCKVKIKSLEARVKNKEVNQKEKKRLEIKKKRLLRIKKKKYYQNFGSWLNIMLILIFWVILIIYFKGLGILIFLYLFDIVLGIIFVILFFLCFWIIGSLLRKYYQKYFY